MSPCSLPHIFGTVSICEWALKKGDFFLHLRKKKKRKKKKKREERFHCCEFWMTKTLAGKDTYSRHIEFLIRNINFYLKFVDAACRVLALMLEKLSDFFFCLFILVCYRHIFFLGSGSFTLSHTSCQLVRTLLLLEGFSTLALWWVVTNVH